MQARKGGTVQKQKAERESIKKHEVFKSSSDIQRDPHKAALSGVQPKSGKLQNKDQSKRTLAIVFGYMPRGTFIMKNNGVLILNLGKTSRETRIDTNFQLCFHLHLTFYILCSMFYVLCSIVLCSMSISMFYVSTCHAATSKLFHF